MVSRIYGGAFVHIFDGYEAIDKPRSLSSAQVVRDLQKAFNPSRLFAPLVAAEKAARGRENAFQRRRRRDKRIQVKIGHGGTLDPLATGVLVIGVGKGTKQLPRFIECTKSYDATMLFGFATDSYDVLGKVLAKASYDHISHERLENALQGFRGQIMQTPPIYSAIWMQGKRLYEYAREGKELPAEIQGRPVTVQELVVTDWLEPGSHQLQVPAKEADDVEKELAKNMLQLEKSSNNANKPDEPSKNSLLTESFDHENRDQGVAARGENTTSVAQKVIHGSGEDGNGSPAPHAHEPSDPATAGPSQSPLAVRLSMTVTSGFYVRSLCHDLGKSVGSLAIMATLCRTRQGDFELGRNVLAYDDLGKGEDVWGPKVAKALEAWNAVQDLP